MKKEKGITGILRPNGEFLMCSYGNHCVIATKIPKEEENDCIYFSSDDNYSVIYFNENLTTKQFQWLVNNIDLLDDVQYKCWKSYINKLLEV